MRNSHMKILAALIAIVLIGIGGYALDGQEFVETQSGLVVGVPKIGDSVSYSLQTASPEGAFTVLPTSKSTRDVILDYLEANDEKSVIHELHFTWDTQKIREGPLQDPWNSPVLIMESSGFISEYGYKSDHFIPFSQKWAFETLDHRSYTSLAIEHSYIHQEKLNRTDFTPEIGLAHCLARAEWQGQSFRSLTDLPESPSCLPDILASQFISDGTEEIKGFTAHRFKASTIGDGEISVSFIPGLAYPAQLTHIDNSSEKVFTIEGFTEGSRGLLTAIPHPTNPLYHSIEASSIQKYGPADHDADLNFPPSVAYDWVMNHPELDEFHEWRSNNDFSLESVSIYLWGGKNYVDMFTFIGSNGSEAVIRITENPHQFILGRLIDDPVPIEHRYTPTVTINPTSETSEVHLPEELPSLGQLISHLDSFENYPTFDRLEITMGTVTQNGEKLPPRAILHFFVNSYPLSWNLKTGEFIVDQSHFWQQLQSLSDVTTDVNAIVNRLVDGDKSEEQRIHASALEFRGNYADQVTWDARFATIAAMALPILYLIFKSIVFLHTRFLPQQSLKLPNRNKLLDIVRLDPGISTNELKHQTELSMGTVLYHLKVLEKDKHLIRISSGKYTRYFPQGFGTQWELQSKAVELDKGAEHRVFSLITQSPGIHAAELARRLNVSRPSILEAVTRLERRGLLKKEKSGRRWLLYPHQALDTPPSTLNEQLYGNQTPPSPTVSG